MNRTRVSRNTCNKVVTACSSLENTRSTYESCDFGYDRSVDVALTMKTSVLIIVIIAVGGCTAALHGDDQPRVHLQGEIQERGAFHTVKTALKKAGNKIEKFFKKTATRLRLRKPKPTDSIEKLNHNPTITAPSHFPTEVEPHTFPVSAAHMESPPNHTPYGPTVPHHHAANINLGHQQGSGSSNKHTMLPVEIRCGEWDEEAPPKWTAIIANVERPRRRCPINPLDLEKVEDDDYFFYGALIGDNLVVTNTQRISSEEIRNKIYHVYFGYLQTQKLTAETRRWEVKNYSIRENPDDMLRTVKWVMLMVLLEKVNFRENPNIRPICFPETKLNFVENEELNVPLRFYTMTEERQWKITLPALDYQIRKWQAPSGYVGQSIAHEIGFLEMQKDDAQKFHSKIAQGGAVTRLDPAECRHVLVGIVDYFSDGIGRRADSMQGLYFLDITSDGNRKWIAKKAHDFGTPTTWFPKS